MTCRVVVGDFSVRSLEDDDDECQEERQLVLVLLLVLRPLPGTKAPTAIIQLQPP